MLESKSQETTVIYLWVLNLKDITPTNWFLLESTLSKEEYAFAQTKKNRDIFIASRALSRLALAHTLCVPTQALIFDKGLKGKPFLREYPSQGFNLSHSQNLIAFAMSESIQIGVDVEFHKSRNYLSIAQHYFHPLEIEQLHRLETNRIELQNLFFQYWTLKEAFFKGLGSGIVTGLHKANFCYFDTTEKAEFDEGLEQDKSDWNFYFERLTQAEQNYSLSLAVNTKNRLVINQQNAAQLLLQS